MESNINPCCGRRELHPLRDLSFDSGVSFLLGLGAERVGCSVEAWARRSHEKENGSAQGSGSVEALNGL